MTFRTVADDPGPNLLRALLRSARAILGVLLTSASFVVLIMALLVLGIGILDSAKKGKVETDSVVLILVLTVVVILLSAVFWIGRRLVRGRRRCVLFLRRFGFTNATRALSFAVTTALGQKWRLVTLDTLQLASVGVQRRTKLLMAIVFAIALAAAAQVVWSYFDHIDQAVPFPPGQAPKTVADALGVAFARGLAAGIVKVASVLVTVFLLSVFGGLAVLALSARYRIWLAERMAVRELREPDKVQAAVRAVDKSARRTFSPRLIIVRATDAIWKTVLIELSQHASVVLIDVSIASENLLWELQTIKQLSRASYILTGERTRIDALGQTACDEQHERLARLLDGEECLVYTSEDSADMRRFSRLLNTRLDEANTT